MMVTRATIGDSFDTLACAYITSNRTNRFKYLHNLVTSKRYIIVGLKNSYLATCVIEVRRGGWQGKMVEFGRFWLSRPAWPQIDRVSLKNNNTEFHDKSRNNCVTYFSNLLIDFKIKIKIHLRQFRFHLDEWKMM